MIDSTGEMIVNNDTLRYYTGYHIDFNSDFIIVPERFTVIEKLGAVNNYVIPNYACYTDNEVFQVQCYEDDNILYKVTPSSKCDYLFLNIQDKQKTYIKTYPNPAHTTWYIQNEMTGILELYSLSGKKVFSKQIQSGTEQINISQFAEGIYFYKISSENGEIMKSGKMVKQ
ncbi:MAG: T9SS type A sorting domain-containing protein [Chitinophagales bacterium]